MKTIGRSVSFFSITLGLVMAASVSMTAQAQTSPGMALENSTIAGAGNVISVTRVPVRNSTGVVSYKNIDIQFSIDNAGAVTLAPTFPKISTSAAPIPSSFKAGTYKSADGLKYTVTGPSIFSASRVAWRLDLVAGQSISGQPVI